MRSLTTDATKTLTVEMWVLGGATAKGVSTSGVSWYMRRTGTGLYRFEFERGITVLSAVGSAIASGGYMVGTYNLAGPVFEAAVVSHLGASDDVSTQYVCVVLDKRL